MTAATQGEAEEAVMTKDSTGRVIDYLVICPNGLQEYSRKLKGLVETSLNIGCSGDLPGCCADCVSDSQFCGKQETAVERTVGGVRESGRRDRQDRQ